MSEGTYPGENVRGRMSESHQSVWLTSVFSGCAPQQRLIDQRRGHLRWPPWVSASAVTNTELTGHAGRRKAGFRSAVADLTGQTWRRCFGVAITVRRVSRPR